MEKALNARIIITPYPELSNGTFNLETHKYLYSMSFQTLNLEMHRETIRLIREKKGRREGRSSV